MRTSICCDSKHSSQRVASLFPSTSPALEARFVGRDCTRHCQEQTADAARPEQDRVRCRNAAQRPAVTFDKQGATFLRLVCETLIQSSQQLYSELRPFHGHNTHHHDTATNYYIPFHLPTVKPLLHD